MQKEFINIASHEFKTPTQSILAYSTLIRRHPERRGGMIDAIERKCCKTSKPYKQHIGCFKDPQPNLKTKQGEV